MLRAKDYTRLPSTQSPLDPQIITGYKTHNCTEPAHSTETALITQFPDLSRRHYEI